MGKEKNKNRKIEILFLTIFIIGAYPLLYFYFDTGMSPGVIKLKRFISSITYDEKEHFRFAGHDFKLPVNWSKKDFDGRHLILEYFNENEMLVCHFSLLFNVEDAELTSISSKFSLVMNYHQIDHASIWEADVLIEKTFYDHERKIFIEIMQFQPKGRLSKTCTPLSATELLERIKLFY